MFLSQSVFELFQVLAVSDWSRPGLVQVTGEEGGWGEVDSPRRHQQSSLICIDIELRLCF